MMTMLTVMPMTMTMMGKLDKDWWNDIAKPSQGCSFHHHENVLAIVADCQMKTNFTYSSFPGGASLHKAEKGCREVRVGQKS